MQRRYDDELNLIVWIRIVWKRRYLVALTVAASVISTAVYSMRLPNLYESSAVITPVGSKDKGSKGLSLFSQQLGGAAGITIPAPSSSTEITNLLNSMMLREKIIKKYALLPALAGDEANAAGKDEGKRLWAGLRALDSIIRVSSSAEENTISITAEFHDPGEAARIVDHFLDALTEQMTGEAKRVALANIGHLERQLGATSDPLIRQKIYNMIAEQVETSLMAEVKENYAFKVIDPPRVPDRKTGPKRVKMLAMSFFVSLAVAVMLAFMLEYVRIKALEAGKES